MLRSTIDSLGTISLLLNTWNISTQLLILFKPTIIAFSGWNTLIDSNVASCERVGK